MPAPHDPPQLELSTQFLVKAAGERSIEVEILDPWENFVRLRKNGKTEYVRQATKTSRDSYVTTLLMENKSLTKRLLAENGISVPEGIEVHSPREAEAVWPGWRDRALVVKPKSTNFGDGVTVFKTPPSTELFQAAVKRAFSFGGSVLVERFVAGREFRFLVIGGETAAVLHRVPANVEGDGIRSIHDLVEHKNEDSRRGEGYKTPLEKLRIGEVETEFLAAQGLAPESVPRAGQTVYLRENSNISTGGDSVDFTDDTAQGYKDIAVRAADSVGARICGVDMLIPDLKAEAGPDSYTIIELNFNPALHIHDAPFKGTNRRTAHKVLDLLGF